MVNAQDQIEKFKEFLETTYKKKIQQLTQKGKKSLIIDFSELSKFDHELSEQLLEQPEDTIKASEVAISQFDIKEPMRARFKNLPESQKKSIRDIRAKDLGQFIFFEGIVRQSSDVRPQVVNAKFECPSCGTTMNIIQLEMKFREPSRCSCGRKAHFRLLHKDLVDGQRLVIEEAAEDLDGGAQSKRMSVFLKEDLVEPKMEKKTTPGTKVRVIGIISEVEIPLPAGGYKTTFDLVVNANNIEPVQEDFSDVEINPKDEEEIKNLAKDSKVFEKLTKSIAPSIMGHDKIKEALLLQLMGGVRKLKKDGTTSRGDIHMLLVGDPGAGKSAMLTFIAKAAPKARYIAGKGASSAGLTASVIKDEFLKGWALEAGAMVLANKGICVLDELDKLTEEDTSALHEAAEQQSYHPDFKVMFADGSVKSIGEFVDNLIDSNKSRVIQGKDCEILPVEYHEVLTTDFNKTYPIKINRVSRHKAPEYFIEILFSNGREIKVTPEHPFFVYADEGYKEISAENLGLNFFIPAPRKLILKEKKNVLKKIILNNMNKKIDFPACIDSHFARFLGYLTTEGHTYYNAGNHYAEIGISNTDPLIINDIAELFNTVFKSYTNYNTYSAESRANATKDLTIVRLCSVPLYNYFKENFKELTLKAPQKYLPNAIRTLNNDSKLSFLRSAFKGDGFVDSERFGYSTASYELAKGYSDLLLSLGCWNYIAKEEARGTYFYKVVISGSDSMVDFFKNIVEPDDKRYSKILKFCNRSKKRLNDRDVMHESVVKQVYSLLKDLKIADGKLFSNIKRKQNAHVKKIKDYLNLIENRLISINLDMPSQILRRKLNITLKELSFGYGCCTASIRNLEKRNDKEYIKLLRELAADKLKTCKRRLLDLKRLTDSEIRFVTIKSIRKVKNENIKWVYDVTVEPNHTFISEGLVLHNTVTIAKANIQATLRAQTTILAAANPKFGRFDPYKPVPEQIEMPPTLINRFDLIFPIRDLPDKDKDSKIAQHVLEQHKEPEKLAPEVTVELLRKYIAYVKQKINPTLSEEAMHEIKSFYVSLRNMEKDGSEGVKPIPITPRQLEALIRLAEASARIRLSKTVTKADAKKAIDLLKYCMAQVGTDPDTGKVDIDFMHRGISSFKRNKISELFEIIDNAEGKGQKTIPKEELITELKLKGVNERQAEEIIEKLKREGELFEPKPGFIQKV